MPLRSQTFIRHAAMMLVAIIGVASAFVVPIQPTLGFMVPMSSSGGFTHRNQMHIPAGRRYSVRRADDRTQAANSIRIRMQQQKKLQESDNAANLQYKEALRNTLLLVAAAAAFGGGVWATMGSQSGLEWFTAYLLEESLSVDNLFVFILLFQYFNVDSPELQKRVLTWGVVGAVVLRAAFIAAGLVAIEKFRPVLLVFAVFLVFSSVKMFTNVKSPEEEDLAENQVVKFATSFIQSTPNYDGDKFFTMVDGVKRATPLFLVLVCIELSDIIFAVDSIPAVFGVTQDPFIVLTSNLFAIIGLRGLYQVISRLMKDVVYLEKSVALVLGFVGAKMIAEFAEFEISQAASLGVVAGILGGGVALSALADKNKK